MKRMMLVVAIAVAAIPTTAHAAWMRLTTLSTQAAQHHPKAPVYHPAKYTCVPGSLGDQLCCLWQVTYPGYGFGTWTDCVVVPAVKP